MSDEHVKDQHEEAESKPEKKAVGEQTKEHKKTGKWRRIAAIVVAVLALVLIPVVRFWPNLSGQEAHPWDSDPMIATCILSGAILFLELAIIIVLKTARTRYSVERQILENRDIHEYVILWNRPRWILYVPALGASLLFGTYVLLARHGMLPETASETSIPSVLGGIWVILCILNVLVEQFHMSIKVIFIIVPTVLAVLLVLRLVGLATRAIELLRYAQVDIPSKLYFVAAGVIGLILFLGWLHGLFHYMAITPNVADMQRGLTETGRQIKNADYDVDFDATDVVERWLFGFGRIVISFKAPDRPPIVFFVPRASKMDEHIRRVRSVTAIDRHPRVDGTTGAMI